MLVNFNHPLFKFNHPLFADALKMAVSDVVYYLQ